jgi:hypothetical protein
MLGLLLALPAATLTQLVIADGERILTSTDLDRWLNVARCQCDVALELRAQLSGSGDLAIVSGDRCVASDRRIDDSCEVIWRGRAEEETPELRVSLAASEILGGTCEAEEGRRTIFVLADESGEDEWRELAELAIGVDTKPPDPPKGKEVIPGEGLVEVVFEAGKHTAPSYQVLCRKKDGGRAIDPPPDAAFDDSCSTSTTAAAPCADATDGPSSTTVLGLQNGVAYDFWVVSIDDHENASEPVHVGDATPAAEEDLWERYKRSGGDAEPGHCFIATAAYGDRDHPDVRALRSFRDHVLMKKSAGRWFVRSYYAVSPRIAALIADRPWAKSAVKAALVPIVWGAKKALGGER